MWLRSDDSDTVNATSSTESTATTTEGALPDLGGRIMFSRFNERKHEFEHGLIDPDGGNEQELTLPGPEGEGRWSPDGQHISVMTVQDDGGVTTAIITPEGDVERTLELPNFTINFFCGPWSPDRARLACEGFADTDPSATGIYVVNASDGGDLVRLTTPPEGFVDFPGGIHPGRQERPLRPCAEAPGQLMSSTSPAESRVGSGTASTRTPAGSRRTAPPCDGGSSSIAVLDLQGNVLEEIRIPGSYLFGPAWSPDGAWLAYSSASVSPFSDIIVSALDGAEAHRITDTPALRSSWSGAAG